MVCISRITKRFPLLAGLALGLWLAASPQIQAQNAPDNTKNNQGDANKGDTTADQQKMNAADRNITKEIRSSIMKESLSTYAHNIKIITQDGKVTLKGPVRSEEERASIESKAVAIAGANNVTDQLDVAPPKQSQ